MLSARRADLAWKALADQVHARSEAVVDTLLAACNGSTLRRLVAGASGQVSTHPLDQGCVGALGVQRVLMTLRRHLREGRRFSPAETEAGPSERFAVAELRRHRTQMRRLFENVKEELWVSVTGTALLEAGALVVRAEARCSDAEIESFRRCFSKVIDGRPSPLETTGADLSEVAEHVAAEEVLRVLGGRPRSSSAAAQRSSWSPPFGSHTPGTNSPGAPVGV